MAPRHTILRRSLPVALIFLAAAYLSGCFFIPSRSPSWTSTSPDPRAVVGSAHSSKPLRVSTATRAQVEFLLGPPAYVSDDNRATAYMFFEPGTYVVPLCFSAQHFTRGMLLQLRFDDHDVLQSYSVKKQPYGLIAATYPMPPSPDWPTHSDPRRALRRVLSTRPTTLPRH